MLDFRDQAALADGVHRARFDEIMIPFLHFEKVKKIEHRAVFDRLAEFFRRNVSFQSEIYSGTFFGVHDIPHFRFAELPFVFQRVFVRRMHLYGKIVLCVDKLD